jgi:hypothetical protein
MESRRAEALSLESANGGLNSEIRAVPMLDILSFAQAVSGKSV